VCRHANRRWVLALLVVVASIGLSSADSQPGEPVADPLARGLGYLADAWQGDAYDDAYLQYVYTEEKLACPLADCQLTYRLLDAYINLAFLDQADVAPGPAKEQFLRGREVLGAIVPLWRQQGIYNVTRTPQEGGIALDTYCIVGLLHEDATMARVVAGHLDGEDWLAEDFYDPAQSFRKLADETWCVALLAVAGEDPVLVDKLVRLSVTRARGRLGESLSAEVRANIALHLVYLLTRVGDPTLDEELVYFIEQLDRSAQDPALESDLLSQANILEALARSGRVKSERLDEIAKMLLANQESDGGWHSRVGEQGSALRVFTSLRALLALKRYEDLPAGVRAKN
jgi:hypothetical protein